ncbi:MAG: ankyrin repeat domain-containing protein [Myxococcales bacterium]|nr:ankyrin repeat domain-containing protein [Myxococcales bacterium]
MTPRLMPTVALALLATFQARAAEPSCAVEILDAGAGNLDRVAKVVADAGLTEARRGAAQKPRDQGAVYFAPRCKAKALELARRLGLEAAAVEPLSWKAAGDIVVAAGTALASGPVAPHELANAAAEGNLGRVQALLARGANINGLWARVSLEENTPLTFAIEKERLEVARYLVAQGADVNARGKHGTAPLAAAVARGSPELVRLLLEKGADPKVPLTRQTLLHRAAARGNPEVISMLLERGLDLNQRGEGRTPLEWASAEGKLEAVKVLWAAGARVRGESQALPDAARGGHWAVVDYLLQQGADIGAKDGGGKTALHHASDAAVARRLLDRRAEPNAKDAEGWTPLHHAAWKGDEALARLLLERGADPAAASTEEATLCAEENEKDGSCIADVELPPGTTPLQVASKAGHARVAAVLKALEQKR